MIELPAQAHKDDVEWITEMVMALTPQMRFKAIEGYDSVFTQAFDSEPLQQKKNNAGRRAANIRLRKFVERFCKAAMGYTIQPPKS